MMISISGFFLFFLLFLSIHAALTKEKRSIQNRMEKVTKSLVKATVSEDKEEPFRLKDLLRKTAEIFVKKGMSKELEVLLAKADIPLRGDEFLVIWVLSVLVPGTLIYLISGHIFLAFFIYLLGLILPIFILKRAQQMRLKTFEQQLSDSLSIMSNALRAGFSFLQALEMVSREMPNPIAKEYARTFREVNLGTPTEVALNNLVARVDSDDLDLLMTAVLIQRQVGGNLAEILDNISETLRERFKIQGQIKTLTAQGRITGTIIGLIPPALVMFLLILNPGYMAPMFKTPIGWVLLTIGLCGEFLGLVVIKKIIQIDI